LPARNARILFWGIRNLIVPKLNDSANRFFGSGTWSRAGGADRSMHQRMMKARRKPDCKEPPNNALKLILFDGCSLPKANQPASINRG
jgi:hypothetical protein